MTPLIAFSVISKLFAKHRASLMKLEADINAGAATTVYIQLHDWPTAADLAAGLTAPANGAVPVKSWPVPAGQTNVYKEFKNGELPFANGIFAVVSTTQATLTIGTVNNKFDSVAGELWGKDVVDTEVQGSGVTSQQVLSDASGLAAAHYLVRVAARNLTASVRYLQLFAIDSPANGSTPLMVWKLAANGDAGGADIMYASFGLGDEGSHFGLIVRSQVNDLSAFGNHQGITFALSSTEPTLTIDTGAGMNIYAEYK